MTDVGCPKSTRIRQLGGDVFLDTVFDIGDFVIRKIGRWQSADVELQLIFHQSEAGEGEVVLNRGYVNEVLAAEIMVYQKLGKGCMKGADRDRGISDPAEQSPIGPTIEWISSP